MVDENLAYPQGGDELVIKIRDLEEKQRILKDRLLLISQNLIEFKEKNREDMLEIKKAIETMKTNMDRTINFLETASSEFSKFARKEDVEVLAKKAKIFQ